MIELKLDDDEFWERWKGAVESNHVIAVHVNKDFDVVRLSKLLTELERCVRSRSITLRYFLMGFRHQRLSVLLLEMVRNFGYSVSYDEMGVGSPIIIKFRKDISRRLPAL